MFWHDPVLRRLVEEAVSEHQDVATVLGQAPVTMALVAEDAGVAAALPIAVLAWQAVSSGVTTEILADEGEAVRAGQTLLRVQGPADVVIAGHRVAANLVAHASGIAAHTRRLAEMIRFYNATVLHQGFETPIWHRLEEYSVRVGGGIVSNGVYLNRNVIQLGGGMQHLIAELRKSDPMVRVEPEVRTPEEAVEAADSGAYAVWVNNVLPETAKSVVEAVGTRLQVIAGGRISEQNIVDLAKTGVTFIAPDDLVSAAVALRVTMEPV
jgi:nicotinate-nucleotide pyrophosphorylase (carboxylating)